MIQSLEINVEKKYFGAFVVINTSECSEWATSSSPFIHTITSEEEFEKLGIDVDEYPIPSMKVGEMMKLNHDYNGVYLMRVA